MPNKNYQKGRAKEYRLKRKLENQGYIVLRTAGSHGFADLVAISQNKHEIKLIQVKPRKYTQKQKKLLMESYNWLNNKFIVKFEVK